MEQSKQITEAVGRNRRLAQAKPCNGSSKTHAAAIVDEARTMKNHGIAAVINTAPGTRQVRQILCRNIGHARREFAKDMTPTAHITQTQHSMTFHTPAPGQLPYASDDALISLMAIENAVDQAPTPSIVACRGSEGRNDDTSTLMRGPGDPVHEGIGVARFGNDCTTVASIVLGRHLTDLTLSLASDIMTAGATAAAVMQRATLTPRALTEVGIGAGVTRRTHQLGTPNTTPMKGTKTPNHPP